MNTQSVTIKSSLTESGRQMNDVFWYVAASSLARERANLKIQAGGNSKANDREPPSTLRMTVRVRYGT